MNRYMKLVLGLATFALLAAASDVVAQNSGYIRRFAANTRTFGTPAEIFTNLPPLPAAQGGLVIYDKSFFTADDINVLYVTISATGDGHFGARSQFACLLDDVACNPGPNPVGGSPTGWVTLLRHRNYNTDYTGPGFAGDGGGGAGDLHDNGIHYTWCTRIEGAGVHNVKVKMASSPADGVVADVFIEAVHFYIDGSRIGGPDRCTDTTPAP